MTAFTDYFTDVDSNEENEDDFGFVSRSSVENSQDEDGFISRSDPIKQKNKSKYEDAIRTVMQPVQGFLEGTTPGIVASFWQLLGMGAALDPEEIDHIRQVSERSGIPFDEEKYMQAANTALQYIPTIRNISSALEENYGIPLEPQTTTQKSLRLGSMAATMQPGALSQKAIAGVIAPTAAVGLEELGVPEQFAELGGLVIGAGAGAKTPAIDIGAKTKPSGLPERRFEKITERREVPQKKIEQINEKLESDFRAISDKIIEESPIGETASNLQNDPAFKQASRELLNEAQELANETPGLLPTKILKKEMADISAKKVKGYALSEYDRSYLKLMKQGIEDIIPENVTFGELVEQYRKNNASLGEYFEPGSSKALNRAKKDALLDSNRAIANVMEKTHPELAKVFKEGNARWTKIMDAEAVDAFVNEAFKDGVNYKKMHDFFDKSGYDFTFKRALGEKGYKDFEQLLKDMLTSEAPYKMLKVAKAKGWEDLWSTAGAFILHPSLGKAKLGMDAAKKIYKTTVNALLDKPQLALNWKKGIQELKKGSFAEAEKEFKTLQAEAEILPKEQLEGPKTQKERKGPIIEAGATPKAAGINAFDKYGLTGFAEEAINYGYVNSIDELAPYLRKNLTGKVEAIENELGKSIEEVITDIYGKKSEKKIFSQPKLIEYKPKSIEKQSLKERADTIARESFSDAISGKKISPMERDLLKNTEVSMLQTRQKGQQFHGSRNPIKELNPEIYDVSGEQNIYGAGFYTTDALDIADGYSKAKFAKNPKVYKVTESKPQKLYNAEQPIDEFKQLWIEKDKRHFQLLKEKYSTSKDKYFDKYKKSFEKYQAESDYIIDEILFHEDPSSVRDLYDKIRERAIDEGMKAYEVQEYFGDIHNILEKAGYDGISHKGGLLTNNPEHTVKIYWKPENLEIQEFSYPKEFKKVSKTFKNKS